MNPILFTEEYFDHEYNGTLTNERCIEIPLALRFALEVGFKDLIEIGAVLPYYGHDSHLIYDPFDSHPSSLSGFAEDLDIKDKNVLSVSTLEHMGNARGYGPYYQCEEPEKSFSFIKKLNEEARSFFITLPINQHLDLDRMLKDNISEFNWFGYVKTNQNPPNWKLCLDSERLFESKYATPFNCANGVIFIYKGVACS